MHAYFCFSHFWLCVTLWTIVCQAPLSMGFSWQEYWNRLPCSVLFLFFFVNLATYLSILLTFQRTWIWFHHLSFLLNFLFPFCGFLLAYYFFCLFWLSLAFLFLGFWSSSLDFSSFLMYTCSDINFPIITTLRVLHNFDVLNFYFHLVREHTWSDFDFFIFGAVYLMPEGVLFWHMFCGHLKIMCYLLVWNVM